jgi:hypothetical protein
MKKIFTLLALSFSMSSMVNAQINTFPHTEDFETPFSGSGADVNFYPNWTANFITQDTIMWDDLRPHGGTHHVTMIPRKNEFLTILDADLDFTGRSNMAVEFWAASDTNDFPNLKQSRLYVTASLDDGLTWYPEIEIAPNGTFENATTPYVNYTYAFHPDFDNQPNVTLRIFGKSGQFDGLPARLLIDDLTIYESLSDVFPPIAIEPEAEDELHVTVAFSEPVGPSAENPTNYTLNYGLTVASATRTASNDTVNLVLAAPMTFGLLYTMDISNIQDLVGNTMVPGSFDELIYNPVTHGIVISEIFYDQPPVGSGDSIEFVELYNYTCEPIQIGGMRIKYGIQTGLLPFYTMQPGEYYVTAQNSVAFENAYGFTPGVEWQGGSLSTQGEYLEFLQTDHHAEPKMDSVVYSSSAPWPTEGAGLGYSIEMCNNHMDNSDGANWVAATALATTLPDMTEIYATPGAPCDPTLNPVVDLGADGNRCTNSTYELDAGNPGSLYLWSTGETTQTISISTSGEYSVIVNNGTGAAYDTINVTIVTAPEFQANWTPVVGPFCPYEDITFDDNTTDAVDWLWDFGEGTTSNVQDETFQYIDYGTYDVTLTVTNAAGCIDEVSAQVEISGCLGIEENVQLTDVNIYPNPSNGDFNLDVTFATTSDMTIELVDINGRMIFTDFVKDVTTYAHKFDGSDFMKGMYFVKIKANNETVTKKVAIN